MMACPLGKLNPFTAFNKGANGLFRLNRLFNNNINNKLLIPIAATRTENQEYLLVRRKVNNNRRLAGTRNL